MKRFFIWFSCIVAALILIFLIATPFYVTSALLDGKVVYQRTWTSEDFGLPAAGTLCLITEDDFHITAYEVSPAEPQAVIICLTGIQNPSVTAYFGHAKMFFDAGYASILVDVRGHGESDGDRICVGYEETRDVKAVTDYIKQKAKYNGKPVIIMGLSMGAGIAINSMKENTDIDGLVSISAYSSYEEMFCELMSTQLPAWISWSEKPFVQFVAICKFGVNPCKVCPKNLIKGLGERPALLMHTKQDSNVPYSNFERIIKNAPAHVKTMVRDCDEHFFTPDFLQPQNDSVYCATLMEFIANVKQSR